MKPNPFAASKTVVPPPMVRMVTDNSVQTARVLRREIRSESDSQPARRSRMWQQVGCAECAQVHARLEALRYENLLLREALRRLYEEWDKTAYANILMKGESCKFPGPEKLPELGVFLQARF